MHKPNSSTLLLSLLCSLRRKNMLKVYCLSRTVNLIFFVNLNKKLTFCSISFSFPFLFEFHKVKGRWKNDYCFLFYIFYCLCLDDCHLAFCNPFLLFVMLFICFRINKIAKFSYKVIMSWLLLHFHIVLILMFIYITHTNYLIFEVQKVVDVNKEWVV